MEICLSFKEDKFNHVDNCLIKTLRNKVQTIRFGAQLSSSGGSLAKPVSKLLSLHSVYDYWAIKWGQRGQSLDRMLCPVKQSNNELSRNIFTTCWYDNGLARVWTRLKFELIGNISPNGNGMHESRNDAICLAILVVLHTVLEGYLNSPCVRMIRELS